MGSSATIIKRARNGGQRDVIDVFTYLLNQCITNLLALILIIALVFKISNEEACVKYDGRVSSNSAFPTEK